MFYVILAINLTLLGLLATFVVRLIRASPEVRREMLRVKRRTVVIIAGAFVVTLLAVGVLVFSTFGLTGIRAVSAAKDYLHEQYGDRDTWDIQLSDHIEHSKKPETGVYHLHYQYGEKEGFLVAEYFERDGKLTFKITPKPK